MRKVTWSAASVVASRSRSPSTAPVAVVLVAVELDDHLLGLEQCINLVAGDARVHARRGQPEFAREAEEAVLELRAGGSRGLLDERSQEAGARVVRVALEQLLQVRQAQPAVEPRLVHGSGTALWRQPWRDVQHRPGGACHPDAAVAAGVLALEGGVHVDPDAGWAAPGGDGHLWD